MNSQAEFDHWSRRVEYLHEENVQLTIAGELEDAAIYAKAIPGAIEMRERWRKDVLSGK
jgi:hypothetical protein